ncbi:MAG: hypothetical protein Q4E61_04455 [Alphaproteobacteria bacterium]|nr:hypothetical protein [Alphaproteobacteria bacterium]
MVTQFKKALYISTSILFTNIFILNSNAETNTATDIMSGIANIANSFSTTINQQENDLAEEQTTQKTDVNTNTSEQNQENATSEATPDNINTVSEIEDNVIKQTIDSSNTVISDQNNDPNSTDIPTTSTAKIGFIDQNGNILIAPKETVFPSEMKDGELYYFSRDVEKAKENIKNNITKMVSNLSLQLHQQMVMQFLVNCLSKTIFLKLNLLFQTKMVSNLSLQLHKQIVM